jgi:hypothetical protein
MPSAPNFDFLFTFKVSACWQLLYSVLGIVFSRSRHEKIRKHGNSYGVAFVHATLMAAVGVWATYYMLNSPKQVRAFVVWDPEKPFYEETQVSWPSIDLLRYLFFSSLNACVFSTKAHIASLQFLHNHAQVVQTAAYVFISWLLFDLSHIIMDFPNLGGIDQVFAHKLCLHPPSLYITQSKLSQSRN